VKGIVSTELAELPEQRAQSEQAARQQAEKLIEDRARELHLKDQELERRNQELTLAEGELRRERDLIAGVIDAAQAVVLVVHGDGRIFRANPFVKCGLLFTADGRMRWV